MTVVKVTKRKKRHVVKKPRLWTRQEIFVAVLVGVAVFTITYLDLL